MSKFLVLFFAVAMLAILALTLISAVGWMGESVQRRRSKRARDKERSKERAVEDLGVWERETLPTGEGGWRVRVVHPHLGQQQVACFTAQQCQQPDFTGLLEDAQLAAEDLQLRLNQDLAGNLSLVGRRGLRRLKA